MKFYSAYTDDCLKDANKNNLLSELNNVIKKIESNQTSKFLEKYKSPAVVKRAGSYRIIGYEKIFDDIIFIVFLRILVKGKSDYEKFCVDSDSYCKKILPDEDWFKKIIDNKNRVNIKERPAPNKIEKEYLFNPIPDDFEGSLMIYESKRFIQEIKKSDYKAHVAEIIREILDDSDSSLTTERKHNSYQNLIVYYKYFRNLNLLFLHQFINLNSEEKHNKAEFEKICDKVVNTEGILKESFRSYPEFVLYDNDVWLDIQNESEGNLALSTEEAQIFNSIIHNKYEEPLFPLFINGRAGSGKSTLLYYTFAHVLLNHIIQPLKLSKPPIFLTYSSKLLETASACIKKILKTNVKIRLQLKDEKVKHVDNYLNSSHYDQSFMTFKEFQKQLLNNAQREQFRDQIYYRFSNFKEDWNKYSKTNPSKFIRGITSEFAWYVIRTFIKGMHSSKDEFLEPEEYVNLPRELKTVDRETYKIIYESVFNSWYKKHLEENLFWDDQDLTRCVLENVNRLSLEYPAVFCDEAQDFSNIELELIAELSLFSKRKIDFKDVKRIPLAFAGDPLQTINPTGFKWETIRANFYEKVQNDFGRYGKVPLNFKELNNNYRSSKPIVTFNNIIQLIRALLFNLKDITPQKSWFTTDYSIHPTLKINDLSILEESLKEEGKTRTIIIPCEEDQEKEYIQNRDSFLKQKAIINGEVSQNIWSPMNVKGLEYNTVIVYNFGEYLASTLSINLRELFQRLLSSDKIELEVSESKRIELEYFLNKLYVATSRAKKNLVIIDSDLGNRYLWSIFYEILRELPIKFSLAINDTVNWDEENEISEFQFSTEIIDLADDKPEDLARQYYQDGLSSSNPRKLRSAAEYYKASQKLTEANRALAKAYELENNFIKAAEYYEKIQDDDKATSCFWRLNDIDRFKKIIDLYTRLPKNPNNVFYLASVFMISQKKKNDSILFLRDFSKLIRDSENIEFYMITDRTWDPVYNTLIKALEEYSRETATLSDWDEAIKILKRLSEIGIQLRKKKEYIELLFNLKQYKDVIEELTELDDLENELFLRASAFHLPYPENLEFYFKLRDHKQIRMLYMTNTNKLNDLKFTHLDIILKSLIESQELEFLKEFLDNHSEQIDELLNDRIIEKIFFTCYEKKIYSVSFNLTEMFKERKDDVFFVNILNNIISKNDSKLVTFILCLFLAQEITFNRFHTVIDILENKRAELSFIPKGLINKASLEKVLLYKLATKKELKASKEPRERIQAYVRSMLIDDNRWISLCPLHVASAAIERLELHKNARDFYEKIYKGNFSNEEEKDFAKRRWLKVKEKQALNSKEEEIKQQILEDVEKFYKKWEYEYEFELKDLENYPTTTDQLSLSLDESYSSDQIVEENTQSLNFKLNCYVGGEERFLIKSFYEKDLIKIDSLMLNETVYFDTNKKIFDSKETDVILSRDDGDIKEYSIANWDLILTLEKVTEIHYLTLYFQTLKLEIIKIPIYTSI